MYVGCANGKVYGFNSSGAPLATPSLTVGNGSATGGVVDSPIVDGLNGFIYAVSGSNGANAVLVQAKSNLTSPRTATLGAAGIRSIHAPTFNDAYFTSATSTTWLMYVCGYGTAGNQLTLYGSSFNASRQLTTGASANNANINVGTGPADAYTYLTEFKNGATDWLFIGAQISPDVRGLRRIQQVVSLVSRTDSAIPHSGCEEMRLCALDCGARQRRS